jgi:hypothetical protein
MIWSETVSRCLNRDKAASGPIEIEPDVGIYEEKFRYSRHINARFQTLKEKPRHSTFLALLGPSQCARRSMRAFCVRVARAQAIIGVSFLSSLNMEGVTRWSFTARIEGPQLYRGASASRKDSLVASSHSCISFSPRTTRFSCNLLAF